MAKNNQQLTKANATNQQQITARQAQAQQLRQVEYHEAEVRASAQVRVLSTSTARRIPLEIYYSLIRISTKRKSQSRQIFDPLHPESLLSRYSDCSASSSCLSPSTLTRPYYSSSF